MSATLNDRRIDVQTVRQNSEFETRAATPVTTPKTAVLGRLTWMLFGPFCLLLSLFSLVTKGKVFFTLTDGAYFCFLGAMLLGRWVEFRTGYALTSTGEAATKKDLHRYLRSVIIVGLGVWMVAVLVRNLWLTH